MDRYEPCTLKLRLTRGATLVNRCERASRCARILHLVAVAWIASLLDAHFLALRDDYAPRSIWSRGPDRSAHRRHCRHGYRRFIRHATTEAPVAGRCHREHRRLRATRVPGMALAAAVLQEPSLDGQPAEDGTRERALEKRRPIRCGGARVIHGQRKLRAVSVCRAQGAQGARLRYARLRDRENHR